MKYRKLIKVVKAHEVDQEHKSMVLS